MVIRQRPDRQQFSSLVRPFSSPPNCHARPGLLAVFFSFSSDVRYLRAALATNLPCPVLATFAKMDKTNFPNRMSPSSTIEQTDCLTTDRLGCLPKWSCPSHERRGCLLKGHPVHFRIRFWGRRFRRTAHGWYEFNLGSPDRCRVYFYPVQRKPPKKPPTDSCSINHCYFYFPTRLGSIVSGSEKWRSRNAPETGKALSNEKWPLRFVGSLRMGSCHRR